MRLSCLGIAAAFLALSAACPTAAEAQLRATVVVEGLNQPVAFVQDPADRAVQYVVEQGGVIRVLRDGVLLASPFIDLSAAIVSGGEQGLLGLACPPDPAGNRFFVNFTNRSGDTVVARFRRSSANRLVADASSRFDLQWSTGERVVRQPYANHNGGHLAFGPDGYLYVGLGDGGSGNDPANRAQDGSTLLGKMLRIDVSVSDEDARGFRVPADNPFVAGGVKALPETWAFGLRNPWRYTFDDPAHGGTGALVIADVGQNAYEEVDYEPRGRGGRNYGWRMREGAHPNVPATPAFLPLTDPIYDYDHRSGISIIGGFVYRGQALGPTWNGRYFFADLLGRVWSLGLAVDPGTGDARVTDQAEHTSELGGASALGTISSFGTDADGEVYIVTLSAGRILKIGAGDTDRDGLPDWWELQFGLDPASAAGDNGPDGDPDHDGRTNLEEYRAGTHPRGFFRRTLGAGLATGPAGPSLELVNPSETTDARVLLQYGTPSGASRSQFVRLAPRGRQAISVVAVPPSGGGQAAALFVVEADNEVLIGGQRARPR